MKKKIIFLLMFLSQFVFCQDTIQDKNQKLVLEQYILESEFNPGAYVTGDIDITMFKKFDKKIFPKQTDFERRMYTIKCEFTVNDSLKKDNISLYVGPADMPFNVYLNGKIIFNKGKYINGYNSTIYTASNILLSNDLLFYGNNKNTLCIQLYPLYESNAIGELIVSSYYVIDSKTTLQNLFNVHFIQAASVIALLLFIYFMLLFFARRFKDFHYLYFSLMCLFFIMSYINICLYYDSANEILLEKMTRLGFPLTAMFVGLFIIEYTGLLKNKKWKKIFKYGLIFIISLICMTCSIWTFMLNTKKDIHAFFNKYSTGMVIPIVLVIAFIFLIIASIISVIRRKNLGILFVLSGFIVIILTSFHDIYYLANNITPFCWITPYGYLILVLSIFFTLTLEESKLYVQSISNNREITEKNISLNNLMQNIKLVSDSLVNSSSKLDISINKTIKYINDYGANNRIIMDKILNQFGNIDLTINQIKNRIVEYNEKIVKALQNQQSAVKEVNKSIDSMNDHIDATSMSVDATNQLAEEFSKLANQGSLIIYESKESIDKIAKNSNFLTGVLNSIQEITDKTNVLSINAAIEAANRGEMGKGFSVISAEIRKLANQSKYFLSSSFENINSMTELINNSAVKSDDVAKLLLDIIDECQKIVNNINEISLLMHEQKNQSNNIIQSMESLVLDTETITDLSKKEKYENEKTTSILEDLKLSFKSMTDLLDDQNQKEKDLQESLISIKDVLVENLKNVEILNDSIKK